MTPRISFNWRKQALNTPFKGTGAAGLVAGKFIENGLFVTKKQPTSIATGRSGSVPGRTRTRWTPATFTAHYFANYCSKFLAVNAGMVVIAPKMKRANKIAFTSNANDITIPYQCKASRKAPSPL
jgi:hypothetical protein